MAKQTKTYLCINILPSLSAMELLEYDGQGDFIHLDSEECLFDPATRETLDSKDHFKTVLKRLYDRNKIPTKTPTTLVIPSFFTRQFALPESILGEELETILISEAERFYVFKKVDPVVAYCDIKGGQVLYTAYPKPPLETIKQAFYDLRIPLVSIDCNYTACLRGLIAMGIVQQEVDSQVKWGAIIISDYNVFMAVLEGKLIERVTESPLPIQNTDEETLYTEIHSDFQQFFGYEVLNRMVIVNNAMKFYSPTLIEKLGFRGATDVFDQNERTLASRGVKDAPFPCSLEAIGGALVKVYPDICALELNDRDFQNFVEVEKRRTVISYGLLAVGLFLFISQWGIGQIVDMMSKNEAQTSTALQTEINNAVNSLAILPEIKRKLFIKQVIAENYAYNNLLVQIHKNLPPDAWLTELNLKSATNMKNLDVSLKGGIITSEPLTAYIAQLNTELKTAPLSPTVVPRQKDTQRYFEYTLATGSTTPSPTPGAKP